MRGPFPWTGVVVSLFVTLAGAAPAVAQADAGAPPPAAPNPSAVPSGAPPPPGTYYPPPPGYPPPPPGYYPPPPPGYYPPPPPGYYYPPPPGYVAQRPRRPRTKRGFLAMPFVGIHSYQHDEAANTDPGLRFGSFFGGRFNDTVSLNGELRFDITNPGPLPAGTNVTEFAYAASAAPLFQLSAGSVEFVVGPKLGVFFAYQELTTPSGSGKLTGYGFVVGGNFGLFVPVSPSTSLGVLLSLELAELTRACATVAGIEECADVDPPTSEILGLTAAALF